MWAPRQQCPTIVSAGTAGRGVRQQPCKCQKGRRGACVDRDCAVHVLAFIQIVLHDNACAREQIARIGWILAGDEQRAAVQAVPWCRCAAAVRAGLGEGVAVPGLGGHGTCDVCCASSTCPCLACDRVFRFVRAADLAVSTHMASRLSLVILRPKVVRGKPAWCAHGVAVTCIPGFAACAG